VGFRYYDWVFEIGVCRIVEEIDNFSLERRGRRVAGRVLLHNRLFDLLELRVIQKESSYLIALLVEEIAQFFVFREPNRIFLIQLLYELVLEFLGLFFFLLVIFVLVVYEKEKDEQKKKEEAQKLKDEVTKLLTEHDPIRFPEYEKLRDLFNEKG